MNQLKLLFKTSRPISWVNTAYPFGAGYLLLGGSLDVTFWVASLFFLIPYNLMMYGINDVFDYESDMRNPRKGGVEGAVTPKKYHPLIIHAAVWSSLPFVVALLALGSVLSAVVLAAVVFFVIAYSAKGLRFKEVPVLDSITSSLHFVGPLLFAFSLVGDVPLTGWVAALAFFLWGMASQAFGAVQDIIPDRQANIRSIATVLGGQLTMRLAFVLYLVAGLLVMGLPGVTSVIIGLCGWLYALNILPFLRVPDKDSATARKAWRRFIWLNYVVGAIVTMSLILVSYQ